MRGIERSWPERSKIRGANKVCRWQVQKKAGKLLFITGSSLYLFKRALHLGGSDIVRRHARPAARLARRLEGEDLFAG